MTPLSPKDFCTSGLCFDASVVNAVLVILVISAIFAVVRPLMR